MNFPEFKYKQYNKMQGLPFLVSELEEKFGSILNEK
jgi:2-oxoglutarate ferredoxin oxidoreductase subunit alpha